MNQARVGRVTIAVNVVSMKFEYNNNYTIMESHWVIVIFDTNFIPNQNRQSESSKNFDSPCS